VDAIDGGFAIGAEKVFAGHDVQSFHAGFEESSVRGAVLVIGRVVEHGTGGDEGAVLVDDVFDEDDGGVGVCVAEDADEGLETFGDFGCGEVRQAIQYVGGGVEFCQERGEFGFHATGAGKSEVERGAVEPSREDGGVGHSGTGSTAAVDDGGTIEEDGLVGRGWGRGEACVRRDADGEGPDGVDEREVEEEFARGGGQVLEDEAAVAFGGGDKSDTDPAPTVLMTDVEVESAGADGWIPVGDDGFVEE